MTDFQCLIAKGWKCIPDLRFKPKYMVLTLPSL